MHTPEDTPAAGQVRHARMSPAAAFRAFWPLARTNRSAVAADAHEFISVLPDGYDSPVGRHGRRLSVGQRRRLALALIRATPVLVLDEPTAGLDDASAARVMEPFLETERE
ncbi:MULTISPECIES: ATP-binding cassette domain-containing protein [unclassified Streptomyces]|uniref:ATP-binding cassette domain-containing protein n=1 Tax=unclassified Streptomyces TaxID=2593676 RepID=UPI0034455226